MNTTTSTKKIKLNRVSPGYYCHNNFSTGWLFDIIKNEIGMWNITANHYDGYTEKSDTTTAATLNDVRAYIAAKTAA